MSTDSFGKQIIDAARARPLTANERAWIEFIRLITADTDPPPTLQKIQTLQRMFIPPASGSPTR